MRIAIFDYKIVPTNPAGSCHLAMLRELCREHDFTVFAVEFENPCPERIRWVKVPAGTRPLLLLFVSFHLTASVTYWLTRWRHGRAFDCIQHVESNFAFGDVSYAHFCHRHYLRHNWRMSAPRGLRGLFRWLDHKAHALFEPFILRNASRLVVPSRGLGRELAREYPDVSGKIHVIANPVDIERYRLPDTFDRESFRASLGAAAGERLLIFLALGHFERKGLPLVLRALSAHREIPAGQPLRLIVVGGQPSLVSTYRDLCATLGIASQVTFTGMQSDVRPFLWSSDLFILPSSYEVFPLVALQAAAAGLPLLATQLHGVEEILRPGENGFLLDFSVDSIVQTLSTARTLSQETLRAMGRAAREEVRRFDSRHFAAAWQSFYRSFAGA